LAPAGVAPIASIVVISELPRLSIGVMQERVGAPSTCTVQAPQSAMPQPNFVPVMPSTSRSTHRSDVSPSTSTVRWTPLILIVMAMACTSMQAPTVPRVSFYSDFSGIRTIITSPTPKGLA
jgi:hypothetical protein